MSSISSIGQIAINCQDVERATTFYREVLQLPFLFGFPGLSFFSCGEVRLMLSKPSSPELDHAASPVYFRTDDIESKLASMREAGADIEREAQMTHKDDRHQLWIGWFRDTEGNLLALMEERPI